MAMTEAERSAFNAAMLDALQGTVVGVEGMLPGEEMSRALTRDGAQTIIDRLKGRDFKIVRADV